MRRGRAKTERAILRRWLKAFSTVVKVAELLDDVASDEVGRASSRIIGKPPTVGDPYEMMGEDHERFSYEATQRTGLRNRNR